MRVFGIALLAFGLASGAFAKDIRIYIIHGFEANAESYWYPWLKSELSSEIGKAIKAENIALPDMPKSADIQLWKDKIKEVAGEIDEATYFVAHGVSGIAVLKFIEESGKKVGGIVLVSGFVGQAPQGQSASAFNAVELDYKNLMKNIRHITLLSTRDDKIAPYKLSEDLANKLNAKFILEQGGKIKQGKDDYVSPRIIYSETKAMIDADLPKEKSDKK
ncbi:RBBP9/YdeN family alpha/beta hydrolase [Helicobacter sp. 23-1044]